MLALFGILLIGGGGLWRAHSDRTDLTTALRSVLWAAIGGLLAYVLFALGILLSDYLRSIFGAWAALLITLLGGGLTWLWFGRKM